MDKIKVAVLNPTAISEAEKMMVCAARLTQSGHKVKDLDDFLRLYDKSYTEKTVQNMTSLPHPTIQKFGVINVVVVGASRRFLAQITRHQNEVKFMSASLQYSDYSDEADFVVPYELLDSQMRFPTSLSARMLCVSTSCSLSMSSIMTPPATWRRRVSAMYLSSAQLRTSGST